MPPREVPSYDELMRNPKLDGNVSWGVFGADDEIGTPNLITPECRVRAAAEIRRGVFFNLSLQLDEPVISRHLQRAPYRHLVFTHERNTQDEVIDNFYPQASTQIDGLRHVQAREFGFYNGIAQKDGGPDGDKLGIDRWAKHGLVGRGVLVDVARRWDAEGFAIGLVAGPVIPTSLLDDILREQKAVVEEGDILLIRTGYLRALAKLSKEEQRELKRAWPGLSAGEATARWLWDRRVSLVGADNPAVEARPGDAGYLHRRLIPMLGMPLGELITLEELADDCARDGRYSFFFASVPLNLPRGVGSPANAFALK
jgi:kynurenine formamidase